MHYDGKETRSIKMLDKNELYLTNFELTEHTADTFHQATQV